MMRMLVKVLLKRMMERHLEQQLSIHSNQLSDRSQTASKNNVLTKHLLFRITKYESRGMIGTSYMCSCAP